MAAWPPTTAQRAQLAKLADLIARYGSYRFGAAHLVRADREDFPGEWQATASATVGLLERLCWHAYLDVAIELDDARATRAASTKMLRSTQLDFVEAANGRVRFRLEELGNDDVAGLASHLIGAAFLELVPGTPFREAAREHTAAEASVAAIYLGLGVLAANSASYRRYASRTVGYNVHSEESVARHGGLELEDAVFLLAVQDVLRDDAQGALDTLLAPQREQLAQWHAVLDGHEAELRAMLELDDHPPEELVRAAAPRPPPELPELERKNYNADRITFRVPYTSYGRAAAGFMVGLVGGAFLPHGIVAAPVLAVTGLAIGLARARRYFICSEADCRTMMTSELEACPHCGGTIAETIAKASMRLARREELEDLEKQRALAAPAPRDP